MFRRRSQRLQILSFNDSLNALKQRCVQFCEKFGTGNTFIRIWISHINIEYIMNWLIALLLKLLKILRDIYMCRYTELAGTSNFPERTSQNPCGKWIMVKFPKTWGMIVLDKLNKSPHRRKTRKPIVYEIFYFKFEFLPTCKAF